MNENEIDGERSLPEKHLVCINLFQIACDLLQNRDKKK